MKKFRIYMSLFSVLALVFLLGCSNVLDPDDHFKKQAKAESQFSFSIDVGSMSKLVMEGISGTIKIVGQDEISQVRVSGTKIVRSDTDYDARDFLTQVKVSISETNTTLFVATEQPEDLDGREVNIDYEITMPRQWALSVTSVNGECALDSLAGYITAQVTNGNVSLDHIRASMNVQVTNGQIAGMVELPLNGTLSAQTTNGLIVMSLLKTTSAQFSARVTNGTVNVSGLTLRDMMGSQKEIRGILGAGEGTIDLRTVNGNISVSGL
jgi:DUF4097 and DUF4098 domain-containing protein YvlB